MHASASYSSGVSWTVSGRRMRSNLTSISCARSSACAARKPSDASALSKCTVPPSIVPPNFFKPSSVDALIDYLKAALKTSEKLPFYYYHTSMSGVNFDMQTFLEKADGKIKNLAGIKFNYPDLYMFQRCLRACGGKYDITWGIDEWFAGAVALGAQSAIGSTYNYSAGIYYKIWQAVKKGDFKTVEKNMKRVCDIVDILVQYGGVAGGKVMCQMWGVDLGDVRMPNKSISSEGKADILKRIKKIGVK